WEGLDYRLDLASAERRRLQRVREKQGGAPIDVAVEIGAVARRLAAPGVTVGQMVLANQMLRSQLELVPVRHADLDALPPGVEARKDARSALVKAIDVLQEAVKAKDTSRAARLGARVGEIADWLTAEALVSFAYAIDIGDPEGTALLVGDVSSRHHFGIGR